MPTFLLYLIVILSWGTSWLAIKFQIDAAPPTVSVAYRFLLAGALLISFAFFRGEKLKFSRQDHLRIATQAVFLFCLNYIFIYFSEKYIVSGLVSVIFSTMAFMNILNARIFLQQPFQKRTIVATLVGFLGIIVLFQGELQRLSGDGHLFLGIGLCLVAAYSASLGNIVSVKNQARKIPLIPSTAYGMLYGGLLTLIIGLTRGESFHFPATVSFISSLVYLSVMASIVAFLAYLTLLQRMGPAKAAYSTFVFPLVAITLSVMFEHYILTTENIVGIMMIIAGNILVMRKVKAPVVKPPLAGLKSAYGH
jgi:drug/metabolite transporter (DMT)-like permease